MLYDVLRKLEKGGAVFGHVDGRTAVQLPSAVEGLREELCEHRSGLEALVQRWGGGPAGRLLDLYLSGYVPIHTTWELENAVEKLLASRAVAMDLETTGLDPRMDRVRLISLADDFDTYVVDAGALGGENLGPILSPLFDGRRRVVFHNAVFDLGFLTHMGVKAALGSIFDTGLAEQVLRAAPNMPKLKVLAWQYLGLWLDKGLQKSDWSVELTEEHFRYAAADARVTRLIYEKQAEELTRLGLDRAASIDFDAVLPVAWMRMNGVPINLDCWTQRVEHATENMQAWLRKLEEAVPGLNWRSPTQVAAFFRSRGLPIKDTQTATLKRFVDKPLVKEYLHFVEWRTQVERYGGQWLSKIDKTTGRVHPSWKVTGALTGRMACTKPNAMQVPRDSDFRRCFEAPPGRVLIKADYSQIELRLGALIAKDHVMLEAIKRGEDLHRLTAAAIAGVPPEKVTKEQRQAAKAVNFGFLYGMGPSTFQETAFKDYGLEFSLEEAKKAQRVFKDTYPGIKRWHNETFAIKGEKEVRTLTGRRAVVEKGTKALNMPVQGTGADIIKRALALLYARRDELPGVYPVLAVHDELVLEAPEEKAEEARRFLTKAMLDAAQEIVEGRVPIEVEDGAYRDWGVTEVEKEK